MLVVKIELHSAANGEAKEIGRMVIANDGTSQNPKRGDYTVKLGRRGAADSAEVWQNPLREAQVLKYPRLSFSVWVLVARALKNLGIERFADFYEDQLDVLLSERGL